MSLCMAIFFCNFLIEIVNYPLLIDVVILISWSLLRKSNYFMEKQVPKWTSPFAGNNVCSAADEATNNQCWHSLRWLTQKIQCHCEQIEQIWVWKFARTPIRPIFILFGNLMTDKNDARTQNIPSVLTAMLTHDGFSINGFHISVKIAIYFHIFGMVSGKISVNSITFSH